MRSRKFLQTLIKGEGFTYLGLFIKTKEMEANDMRSFILAFVNLLVLLIANMYPSFFPLLGKMIIQFFLNPYNWVVMLVVIIIIQYLNNRHRK